MLKCLKQWSLYTELSSATKVFTRIIESTGLEKTFQIKSYHPIHITFLCACPHSLNCMHFPKSDMFSPLASTTIPKLGKGYIWRMYCCYKSSTLASYQQEKVLHSNLPHEPPSCTYLASSSRCHGAKKQMTSAGHPICSPSCRRLAHCYQPRWVPV